MTGNNTPHALVADDDVIIRMDAVDILQKARFRVKEAGNVEEALELLTGFDLARHRSEHWPHIGIIIASGMMAPIGDELPTGLYL
ncbi:MULTISPECIES: response regulator [unclassified Ochrobactrum]|uniref:response regulator n=1 Tax=unclassified Ochrobactrum TaxID=239106 RepID=UPI00309D96E8